MNTSQTHCHDAGVHHLTQLARITAAACALLLAATAAAAPRGKVELCHLPPDNPENTQTLTVNQRDVDDHLAHGDFLGACPPTAAELDPPTVAVDHTLAPAAATIAGVDGGAPRPLARMKSDIGPGYHFDFVENEVYLVSDDPADLAAFQSRWPSHLLRTIELAPSSAGQATNRIYLLAVDVLAANVNRLDKDLALIAPRLHGQHQVSSEAALKLLALVASEIRQEGLRLGINALLQSSDIAQRNTEEAMIGERVVSGLLAFDYSSNAFEWPYLERDPRVPETSAWPLDTGAADAVRAVELAGKLGNRVRTLIADGGFYPNEDFPDYTMVGPVRTVNPDPSGCGSGSPPEPGSACGTHGTHVTMAGFARPDNAFGGFGPGGAVSELILLQAPSIDAYSLGYFILDSIPAAISARPQIINMSASIAISSGWCFIACEPLDLVSQWLHDNGIVFVAAAGNNRTDIDATDDICFFDDCIEFEETTIIPCELDHVICVGAHTFFESRRAGYSNYGTANDAGSVDIFAPGNIYSVDAIMADSTVGFSDDLYLRTGTSYASPFVAGVFALTWAANPSLTATGLVNCVLNSAHTSSLSNDRRRVNALGAVSCAMGGTHPWVAIQQPAEGAVFERGVDRPVLVAESDDYEDGPPAIHWVSTLDGDLGSTSNEGRKVLGLLDLSIGPHNICAQVTDSSARNWQDCRNVVVTSARPTLEMVLPTFDSEFYVGQEISLSAIASDPDGPDPALEWRVGYLNEYTWEELNTIAFGAEATFTIPEWMVPGRRYRIAVRATDETGATREAAVSFGIINTPANLPPAITIEAPAQGETFVSPDGGPVAIRLVAQAQDPEDGTIPFAQISWYYETDGGLARSLPVTTDTRCEIYNPIADRCELYEVIHSFELTPTGSQTVTRFRIFGVVRDSGDQRNSDSNGIVVVYVSQLII